MEVYLADVQSIIVSYDIKPNQILNTDQSAIFFDKPLEYMYIQSIEKKMALFSQIDWRVAIYLLMLYI